MAHPLIQTFFLPSLDANYSFIGSFELSPPDDIDYFISANPIAGGRIEENKERASLSQRTFIAQPFDGYSFIGWSRSGEQLINHSPLSQTIDLNLTNGETITAQFAPQKHDVQLEVDTNKGEVSGSYTNIFPWNKASLNAIPHQYYYFSNWEVLKSYDYQVTHQTSAIDDLTNRIFINNLELPELSLVRGYQYTFTNSLNGDEIYFSTHSSADQSHKYSEGISIESATKTVWQIPQDAPDVLYYYSSVDPSQGNQIKIIDIAEGSSLAFPNSPSIEPYMSRNLSLKPIFKSSPSLSA